jgi:O-acetyl-ADP-ribose deacetylase (regulator of RNase III)
MVIKVVQGDLTAQPVAAIVNAANEHLQHGAGVAAAIVQAGGQVIQTESDEWVAEHGPIGPGRAAITSAGHLPAQYVIHVVGPRYREGQDNESLLQGAVTAALNAAAVSGCRTVALPAISAGIFGYPRAEACQVIVAACRTWLDRRPGLISEIRLVGFDQEVADQFRRALDVDKALDIDKDGGKR